MKLNENQELYMSSLSPIDKAIYTFSLLALKTQILEERDCLIKIAKACEACTESETPLVEAVRSLAFMLASETLSLDDKSSILSAIDVIEKIKENETASMN